MGCLSETLVLIALIVRWFKPEFGPWGWYLLGSVVVEQIACSVLQESVRLCGLADYVTKFWMAVCVGIQIGMAVFAVWAMLVA
jgi:hypothetical protein